RGRAHRPRDSPDVRAYRQGMPPSSLGPAPPRRGRGLGPTCEDRRVADSARHPASPSPHPGLADSPFLRAARGLEPTHTPVWFMRQAGRSLPEYRAVREGIGMLESCMRPDLVTEITLQPVRRYGVDAAIFFSDIVLPLKAVGVDLDIVAGVGPVVASPVRTLADVEAIPDLTPDHVPF